MATPDEQSLRKEFKLQKPAIGKGSYGKVYKATWKRQNSEQTVAVKIFPLDVKHSRNAFEAESRMSVLLQNNPYCVTIKKAYISNNKGYIVMNLLSGDLMDIQPSIEYNEEKCCKMFFKICCAINLLHKKRVVHLDIKPDNILIDEEQNPFLADFGSSAIIPLGGRFNTPCGTDEFAAPEVLGGEVYSPFPADIWSLGVLFYTMLTGKYPKVKKDKYRPNEKLTDECNALLDAILQRKPQMRPDIKNLLQHEFFAKYACVPPIDTEPQLRQTRPKKSKSPRLRSFKLKKSPKRSPDESV